MIYIIIAAFCIIFMWPARCSAEKQVSIDIQDLYDALLTHLPIGIMCIDEALRISHIYYKLRENSALMNHRFSGKSILKTASYLLIPEDFNRFSKLIKQSVELGLAGEITNIKLFNQSGLPEYYKIKVIPRTPTCTLLVWQNITEAALLEEEFFQVSENFANANKELSDTLSNLDLYMMDRERAHNDLACLHRIIMQIQATHVGSMDKMLDRTLDVISSELRYTKCAIYLINESTSAIEPKAQIGFTENLQYLFDLKADVYQLSQKTITLGQIVHIPRVCSKMELTMNSYHEFSKVVLPLIMHNRILGCLYIEECSQRTILTQDLDLLRSIAGHVSMVIDHILHDQLVERLAVTDGLTGLFNHRFFRDRLTDELHQSKFNNYPTSLIMLDIDNFKKYNDLYGHSKGDLILKHIAHLLAAHSRSTDTVARYGGEEFAIIMPKSDTDTAALLAENLRTLIKDHFFDFHEEKNIVVTISLGVSSYPDHALTDEDLINAADKALYLAKREKNRVCIFNDCVDLSDG